MSKEKTVLFGYQSLVEQYAVQRRRVAGERQALDDLKAKIVEVAARSDGSRSYLAAKTPGYYVCVSFRDKRKVDWSRVVQDLTEAYNLDDGVVEGIIKANTEVAPLVPHVGPPTKFQNEGGNDE